jgi:hypothetical protein
LKLFFPFLLLSFISNSQDSLSVSKDSISKLNFEVYIDAYYGYNSTQATNHQIPYFVSMNNDNEFSINLAYISASYQDNKIRAKLTPAFGSYMESNYSSEKNTFKFIQEASVGFKPFKRKNNWIDLGVLASPYTNETAISSDHIAYSRSLSAEYVPYYLCGAKMTLPLSSKLNAYVYLVNGWQQISDVNQRKSLGTQLEYKPNSKHLFNWNTYIGNEKSIQNPVYRNRLFSDIYWTYNLDGKLSFSSCFYVGFQEIQNSKLVDKSWWQGNFLARYSFTEKASISARIEYFSDPNSIQIQSLNTVTTGFETFGASLGFNYKINKFALLRFESRYFNSSKKVFLEKEKFVNYNYWFLTSLVFRFNN